MTLVPAQQTAIYREPLAEGFTYGFVQHSRAWYAWASRLPKDVSDEIMVGLYATDGGCRWEFSIRWICLPEPTPKVGMFIDAWQAFAEIPDLFAKLSELDGLTPTQCCDLLEGLGFVDMTKVEGPNQPVRAVDPQEALQLAGAYIQYVKERDPEIHQEADGTPSIEKVIAGATGRTA